MTALPSDDPPPDRRRGAHRIPDSQRRATRRILSATAGLVGAPSDAERTRTLLTHARHAMLSTVGREPDGYPFGSLVGYALDDAGRPVLCLSDLAEHSVNLAADPRASLLVGAVAAEGADQLACARATLVGDLHEVSAAEHEDAHGCYRAVHPGAFYSSFPDFRLYRLEIAAVRYVGGFGRMSWVDADHYRCAEPDPLRRHIDPITQHMNDDHTDALVLFCRAADRPDTSAARMTGIDRYGFDVLATDTDGDDHAVRIDFPPTPRRPYAPP